MNQQKRDLAEKIRNRIWLYWSSITCLLADDLLDHDTIDEIFSDLLSLAGDLKKKEGDKNETKHNEIGNSTKKKK